MPSKLPPSEELLFEEIKRLLLTTGDKFCLIYESQAGDLEVMGTGDTAWMLGALQMEQANIIEKLRREREADE